MRSQLFATLLIVFLSGCEPPPAQPGSTPAPPNAAPTMSATSVWNQTQVEEFFKEEFKFTTIALKSTGGHNYQGTGVDPQGLTYTLTFKQVPGGYKAVWSTESGNGTITFGIPVP